MIGEGQAGGDGENRKDGHQRQSEEIGNGEAGDIPARGGGQQKRQCDQDQKFREHLANPEKRTAAFPLKGGRS